MNKDDDEKKYGSSGINILWPITSNEDYKTELSNAKDGKVRIIYLRLSSTL